MFFDGLIAIGKGFELRTYRDGELIFMGNEHIGTEIIELGKKGLIDDSDIDTEDTVDILVDKFICIYNGSTLMDDDKLYFNDYDEAIEGFKKFLKQV